MIKDPHIIKGKNQVVGKWSLVGSAQFLSNCLSYGYPFTASRGSSQCRETVVGKYIEFSCKQKTRTMIKVDC